MIDSGTDSASSMATYSSISSPIESCLMTASTAAPGVRRLRDNDADKLADGMAAEELGVGVKIAVQGVHPHPHADPARHDRGVPGVEVEDDLPQKNRDERQARRTGSVAGRSKASMKAAIALQMTPELSSIAVWPSSAY